MENKPNLEYVLEVALNCACETSSDLNLDNTSDVLQQGQQIYMKKIEEFGLSFNGIIPNFNNRRKNNLISYISVGFIFFGFMLIALLNDCIRTGGKFSLSEWGVLLFPLTLFLFYGWFNFFRSPILQLEKMIILSNRKILKTKRKYEY
jgi:hypothetical protein